MGYPPPGPPPQHIRPRGGKNQALLGCGLSIVAAVLLMGSCGVGMAIGADPEASSTKPTKTRTVTAKATVTVTAEAAAPSPEPATAEPTSAAVSSRVALPNVVGKNGAIAQDALNNRGITNIQFASAERSDTVVLLVANWRVTKQEPKAGSKVRRGALVVLTAVKVS